MGDFLPGYEPPRSNAAYTKLEQGETEIRILSNPIIGWEYWIKNATEKKPVRLPYTPENQVIANTEAMKNQDPKDQKARHFWAFTVWNYSTKRIEICQFTQRGIQSAIMEYTKNSKWGNPINRYDITVVKSWEKESTEYKVLALPHSDTSEEIKAELAAKPVDLKALFYGADPFDKNWKSTVTFTTEEEAEQVFSE